MKKLLMFLTVGLFVFAMAGCTNSQSVSESNSKGEQEVSENKDSGEDSDKVNTDESKKAILVVSFGTSYNDSREKTIGAVENKITEAFPDYEVRRAFTSGMIINKLKDRDGLEIDNVEQAMQKLYDEGFGKVVVQPTHIMNGYEYDEMKEAVKPFEAKFSSLSYGTPLLNDDKDYEEAIKAVMSEIPETEDKDSAVVFMGHGTDHPANSAYAKLNDKLKEMGYDNVFVGTVESTPDFDDVLEEVNNSGAKKVVLYPFMIVAGDHANNDMAGDEEDSWKTMFKKEGYETIPVIKGLGEYEGIRNLFVEHTRAALEG